MGCSLDFTEDVRDTSNGEAAGAVYWGSDNRFEPKMQTGGGDSSDSVKTLRPGQRISAAGATCVASGDRAMACERDGKQFTYDGGDVPGGEHQGKLREGVDDGEDPGLHAGHLSDRPPYSNK
ncbi:hypothetical protein [Corynebacterium variabile]|uniref:hypothetical protein n=1 Tax=Corynebacterium variabile TaxID=1727 RepID=UPI001DC3A1C5|nr:hypothetical protein [Corynebacterium variabile]HJG46623.1 hypothetical protein [Corynebacterium variabile]